MELFRRILPLAVAAAFSPTYLVIAAVIVSTRDGRSRLVNYVLGWMLAIITLGLVFGSLAQMPGASGGGVIDAWVDVILGALMAVLGVLLFAFRERLSNRPPKEPDSERTGAGTSHYVAFGAVGMFTNLSSLVPFAAATREIAKSTAATADRMIAATFLFLMTSLPVLTPLVIVAVAGDRAQPILDRGALWAKKYGAQVATALFLGVGAWLVIRGGIVLGWW